MSFVKSALTSNPNSNNHSHVILQGEDRIFFTPHSEERRGTRNQINSVGSKQWTVIPMPCNYLSGNWPIRSGVFEYHRFSNFHSFQVYLPIFYFQILTFSSFVPFLFAFSLFVLSIVESFTFTLLGTERPLIGKAN